MESFKVIICFFAEIENGLDTSISSVTELGHRASTTLGHRGLFIRGGEENAAPPHFPPLIQNRKIGHRA
ncbi:MAG: hypothetical protein B7Z16_11275 [Algoriphagus sp. 32-45-6]|nr:MAG: hypothetical protein B7Z16_11275 [Algoriphagus sp. 32-45-6]